MANWIAADRVRDTTGRTGERVVDSNRRARAGLLAAVDLP